MNKSFCSSLHTEFSVLKQLYFYHIVSLFSRISKVCNKHTKVYFFNTFTVGVWQKNCVQGGCNWIILLSGYFPANIYLLKVNNRNTRKRCEICSELTIKSPERRQWRRSDVFIVNFEHISHLFLVFLLSVLNMQMLAGVFIFGTFNWP